MTEVILMGTPPTMPTAKDALDELSSGSELGDIPFFDETDIKHPEEEKVEKPAIKQFNLDISEKSNFFHPEPTKDDYFKPPPKPKNNFFDVSDPDQEYREKLELEAGTLAFRAVEDARSELAAQHEKEKMHEMLAQETLKLIKDYMSLTADQ